MASLSCLGLMEPGEFGSDSGTVVVVAADVGFPITAYATFTINCVATFAFIGVGAGIGLFNEAGASTVTFIGESTAEGSFAMAGVGAAAFIGAGGLVDSLLTEDGDHILTEDGDRILMEG